MKNLISRQRDGAHSPEYENEPENLKYRKKIKYDVYTEIWEFDNKLELLQILELTCNDNQRVVYTDYDDLNTYHIIDVNDYDTGFQNIIKDVYKSTKDNSFLNNLVEFFDNSVEDDDWDNYYEILDSLPTEVKAILAKFGDFTAIEPEDV